MFGIGKTVLAAAVVVVQATTMLQTPAHAQAPASPVGVDDVVVEPLAQTVPVLGRIVSVQRGTVAAQTRGPVEEVRVNVGDRVREGDIIVVQAMDRLLRSRDVAQQVVDAALASVTTARSQLALAEQELARLEKLQGSAAFSSANRDDKAFEVSVRRAEVGEARAGVARARAELEEVQLDVDLGIIRAPYNGVVVERHTERGAYIAIGDPVVTLINDEDLEIEADVPADRIASLTEGREVALRLRGAFNATAVVRAVVPEENALTRTRVVRFIPDLPMDGNGTLASGQSVSLEIPVGDARDVVTVHKDAILPRGGDNIVYVVQDDLSVAPRPVQLGEAVGVRFVVLGGLAPGDTVVTRGNERLRPGQSVTWPGAPTADPSDAAEEIQSEETQSEETSG